MKSLRLTASILLLMVIAATTSMQASPIATPYITSETHYMVLPKISGGWGDVTNISNEYEGIFYVQQDKRNDVLWHPPM